MTDTITRTEVERTVKSALARTLRIPESDVRLDSRLESELGLDSMGMINVNIALEQQFHLALPACEQAPEEGLQTVRQVIDFVVAAHGRQSTQEIKSC